MALTPAQKNDVLAALDQYALAYQKKDREKILSLASRGISGFGSGPDEIVTDSARLREQVSRDLMQADAITITFSPIRIAGQMPFAWITALCCFQVTVSGEPVRLDGCITVLFRNTGNRWLIEQIHFSLPKIGQESGQSYKGCV